MAASPTERSWCALEFVAFQRAFRRQFGRRGPPETSIRMWYEEFRYRGCICHQFLQNTPIIYTHPVFPTFYLSYVNCTCFSKCLTVAYLFYYLFNIPIQINYSFTAAEKYSETLE
jgi:hypothetical protein